MTTAALYARISIGDAKTPAVERQLSNLEKFADQHGYEIVRRYTDDGKSAYSGKVRPGFLDLLLGVENHEFDVILAVADDRLARNDADSYALRSYCLKAKVKWHTISGGITDPSEASGSLLAQITAAIAEYESAVKSERIKRSVADRLAAGKDLMGPRPFAFEPDRLTVREHEAEVLRAGYAMVLEGATLWKVAQMFTESGVQRDRAKGDPWRTQTIRAILLRERNVGRLVVKGELYADDLTRIVEIDTFEAVKAILENPARAPRRGPKPTTYAAIGTVRCGGCGGYLGQSGAKGDGTRQLRCSPHGRPTHAPGVKHSSIRADKLDDLIRNALFIKLITTKLGTEVGEKKPLAALRLRIAELVRQRDVVQELAMTPGANVGAAKKKISSLGIEIDEAQADLDRALSTDTASAAIALAQKAMDDAMTEGYRTGDDQAPTAWWDHWAALPIEDKRSLILALLPNARLMPGNPWMGRLRATGYPQPSTVIEI